MPDDARTIPVTLDIDADVAPALADALTRSIARRLGSEMLEPASVERLFEVMGAISAEARQRGLTDDLLKAELAAYNAERRRPSNPSVIVLDVSTLVRREHPAPSRVSSGDQQ